MNRAAITSVSGTTPVEIRGGRVVLGDFKIDKDGTISLNFKDERFAEKLAGLILDARDSQLLALGLSYTPASPDSERFIRNFESNKKLRDVLVEDGYSRSWADRVVGLVEAAGLEVWERERTFD